ncbi:MAG: hypothetical protein V4677_16280 [Bacteroidota bacterium]
MKTLFNYAFLPGLMLTLGSWHINVKDDGPHGGITKKADNYFIEMKTVDKFVNVWLLDSKMKTIPNKDIACGAKFIMADSTTLNVKLLPLDKDGFVTENVAGCRAIKISFTLSAQTSVSEIFENQIPVTKGK